ncbi:MAG: hypothetical protein ABGY95_05990 [Rubritalea sp.]|uniref:hypothetical protein n=1 Tax=Rubritalea sp. TaxID=2109375 RepID=UPI003242CF3E
MIQRVIAGVVEVRPLPVIELQEKVIAAVLESNEGVMGLNLKHQNQLERIEQYHVVFFEDGEVIQLEAQITKVTESELNRSRQGMTEKQVNRVIAHGGKLSR